MPDPATRMLDGGSAAGGEVCERVARILSLIGNPPNPRTSPRDGDAADCDSWFDGGGCRSRTIAGPTGFNVSSGKQPQP
jgi:hypothetical protein